VGSFPPGSVASPYLVLISGSGSDQFGYADQIVGDDVEEEGAGHLGDAPVLGLSQSVVLLAPTVRDDQGWGGQLR
jgi:hypothetical protein